MLVYQGVVMVFPMETVSFGHATIFEQTQMCNYFTKPHAIDHPSDKSFGAMVHHPYMDIPNNKSQLWDYSCFSPA